MSLENLDDYSSLKGKTVSVREIKKRKILPPKQVIKSATIEEFDYKRNLIQIKYNATDEQEKGQEDKQVAFTIEDFKNGKVFFDAPDLENSVLLKIRKDELKDSKSPFFNENEIGDITKGIQDKPINTIILEQWRVAVDSAMKVSSQRQATNTLFFGALTVLISGILFSDGFFDTSKLFQIIVAIIVSALGICICIAWMSHMGYYGELNRYKYDAIRDMEKYLPVLVFTTEDVFFYTEFKEKKSFSKKERIIPILFIGAFAGIILATIINTALINARTVDNSDSITIITNEVNIVQRDTVSTNPVDQSETALPSPTAGSMGETANEVSEPAATSEAGESVMTSTTEESVTTNTLQE